MKQLLFFATLILSSAAFADNFNIQTDSFLEIAVGGPTGGAAEELVGYLQKGGISPQASQGSISYSNPFGNSSLWGWQRTIPSTSFTFFFKFLPGEEKSLSVNGTLDPNYTLYPFKGSLVTISLPDAASSQLYDLMGKAGIQESAADISKARKGHFVTCYGYHGYPQGALKPYCQVIVAE